MSGILFFALLYNFLVFVNTLPILSIFAQHFCFFQRIKSVPIMINVSEVSCTQIMTQIWIRLSLQNFFRNLVCLLCNFFIINFHFAYAPHVIHLRFMLIWDYFFNLLFTKDLLGGSVENINGIFIDVESILIFLFTK